ncbi:PAS domain-containing sensor histidine kinase [Nocardioides zeae]|uniref:Sensor-like histidine kinase SenX3 n=1 Tax=Nocardioides imazamoxiresistens TaxID=3231893 RepID=A0ABU3PZ74_9ACTN|nr:PAS domain-containing sensor histidine kinase [Nocardioides zeae]MDT9594102.1 PAS domain-containing sensor histidine kinase [Nocardioides zeae]
MSARPNVREAVVITALDGRVLSWATAAQELTGWAADEVVGRRSPLTPERSEAARCLDVLRAEALATGRGTGEVACVLADGSTLVCVADVHLLLDLAQGQAGFCEVLRPVVDAADALPAHEALLEQVVGHAIVRLDPEGVVRSWSLGAVRMKGYRAEEIVGRHFTAFYTDVDRANGRPAMLLDMARRDGLARDVGWRVRADGSRFWGEISINALHAPDGELSGFLKVTRDLTPDKLREIEHQKLFRALGHDLRNPLAAARGFIDVARENLADDPAHAATGALLERSGLALVRITSMLDELLRTVTHASTNDHSQQAHPLRLTDAAAQVLGDLSALHDVRRVELDLGAATVYATSVDLIRVLSNLVGNALRYSDGVVRVAATVGAESVDITVGDSGRGIHPDDLASIFELGTRGRMAEEGDGGHGDGLASVRYLVEKHGGTVHIDSRLDVGTTVTVSLPRDYRSPGAGAGAGALAEEGA